ncbi:MULTISPECIES: hypothetical protein [unclassified Streptomyces]
MTTLATLATILVLALTHHGDVAVALAAAGVVGGTAGITVHIRR